MSLPVLESRALLMDTRVNVERATMDNTARTKSICRVLEAGGVIPSVDPVTVMSVKDLTLIVIRRMENAGVRKITTGHKTATLVSHVTASLQEHMNVAVTWRLDSARANLALLGVSVTAVTILLLRSLMTDVK